MSRGDAVLVKLLSGKAAKMVVWDVLESSVFVCTPRGYEAALKSGRKPRMVQYRHWAVEEAAP